jgi:hypothetical protein
MALKIQLRRDLSTNWTTNNPLLLNGEIGIETDTLKFKIGNGTQRWNSLSSYALKPGEANGVATLNSFGKIPLSQIPDQVSLDTEATAAIQNALSLISTTSIPEGTNRYFTDQRAVGAVTDLINSAVTTASTDATSKANAAQAAAISAASTDATTKATAAKNEAKTYGENFVSTSINLLTTSDIEEGSNLYYTQSRADSRVNAITGPLFINATNYTDAAISTALDNFVPPNPISTTNDLAEGSTNLYFTAARARSAVANTINNPTLAAANSSIQDLRVEVGNQYVKLIQKDAVNGVAALNASGKISSSVLPTTVAQLDSNGKLLSAAIPTTLATSTYVDAAINSLINSAPGTLDTLGEIAALLQSAESVTGLIDLVNLRSPIASPTFTGTVTIPAGASISGYAQLDSPTFTGIVNIPAGASISGYAQIASPTFTGTVTIPTGASIAGYATIAYTDAAVASLGNSFGDPEEILRFADRNVAQGVAGLDSNTKVPAAYLPTITNSLLENSSITLNGNAVSLGGSLNVGYSNGMSSSNPNKITYGTSLTPPSSGNSAGDIYIQY